VTISDPSKQTNGLRQEKPISGVKKWGTETRRMEYWPHYRWWIIENSRKILKLHSPAMPDVSQREDLRMMPRGKAQENIILIQWSCEQDAMKLRKSGIRSTRECYFLSSLENLGSWIMKIVAAFESKSVLDFRNRNRHRQNRTGRSSTEDTWFPLLVYSS